MNPMPKYPMPKYPIQATAQAVRVSKVVDK